ncbi:MAG: acyl-CoA thioesterase [bacterium]
MPRPKLKLPAEFSFHTQITVRVSDVNYAGHLSNDRVLSFIHEARARYLNQFGFTELDVAGCGTIVTDAVIIYKSEGFHGDKLNIHIALNDFHRFGCVFYYKLTNSATGKEIARARTGLVFFDYAVRKMVAVPDEFKKVAH